MITIPLLHRHFFIFFLTIPLLISSISALNSDGTILLSFKNSLFFPPSSLLQNWNHTDPTPCSWSGVTCAPQNGAVISLLLPSSHLLGSIPTDFGRLQHLRSLDLSNNSINGTLPISLFNCSELQTLSLSSNSISGNLPESINELHNLLVLNLSHNYFSGGVLGGLDSLQVLDLSSNLFNGTLPSDFGGERLKYLNLSNNHLSGPVYLKFAENIPANAAVDLSFNKLTGQIPEILSLSNQKQIFFSGNVDLCGKPLKKTCTVPSTHSIPTNVSSDTSAAAAIAAIPKHAGLVNNHRGIKVNPAKIAAIVVGDAAAIALFAVLFLYAYRIRNKKPKQIAKETKGIKKVEIEEPKCCLSTSCSCFHSREETSVTTESDPEPEPEPEPEPHCMNNGDRDKGLVMVDGETELEMETLLKASAYVLGSSRGSIVYKAVVGGGGGGEMVFAVRRIGESGVEKMREFEKIVRVIGKLRHRNLVKVRGFYWGENEKLVIYDYVSNGSLAGAAYKNIGSSSYHLSFKVKLKIAKGIAKGLSYIHDKKHVHGNIKPSNILLTLEMDPVISDFGLEWLMTGKTSYTTRNSDNKSEETTINNTYAISLLGYASPYHAPESMKTLKPNPKWDVYSFGIILLELLSGKVFLNNELTQWNMDSLIMEDNETKILKMVDGFSTNDDVYDKKDWILTCFKLGFSCASCAPQKRPSMREALQVLEKIPCTS